MLNKLREIHQYLNHNEYFIIFRELVILFNPLILTIFLQYSINITPIVFVGQLDRIQLDGVAFAMSVIHIFGTSFGYGLTYACDTLFSQAFGGTDKKKTGFYLQKSVYISLLFPFPIAAVLLNIDHLLLLLGQDPRICEICSVYIATYTPAFPLQYFYFILSRYLQNQNKTWPPFIAVLLGNIFNITAQYLCLYQWNFTYQSSAVCMIITYLIMSSVNLTYLLISGFYKSTWPGWTISALSNWMDFLKLAIPGIAYATFEQINWEAEIFMAGILGIVPMAVHSVLSQTGTLTCPLYVAVGICANVKIGQYLGAGFPDKAKKVVKITLIATLIMCFMLSSIISILKNYWPLIFTSDRLVIGRVSDIIVFFPIYFIPESINGVLAGIMRGCAKHSLVMYLAFSCMYLIGLPVAGMLGFLTKLEVAGLWIGNTTGLTCLMIGYSISIYLFNWNRLVLETGSRLAGSTYEESNEKFEKNPLLTKNPSEIRLHDSNESIHQLRHNRIPSHGITNSFDLIRTKKIIKQESKQLKFKSQKSPKLIIIKRLIILLISVLILLIGIAFRFTIRPDYENRKSKVTNHTISI